ncbi:hypothetical protein DRO69_14295 [Candidatus Bathyarchaeota archaeon]|nr:MAG: hypothetical protein DRO69_14295 [Candidatus Bathyarchaeota archaeon]
MRRKRSPPPSKAAERIKEYLDIINDMQSKRGAALRYDIYRRAGSQSQTDRVIKYLEENGLIERVSRRNKEAYRKTQKGETFHEILRHRYLVGLLTRELSGDRIRRW